MPALRWAALLAVAAEDSVQLTVTSTVAVTLSKTSLSFGNEVINTTSAARNVTLTNTGTATVDIYDITVGDDYAMSANTCGTTLAAGKKCTVSVTFAPSQLGSVEGVLTFNDSAPNSPQAVALSGTGVEPATLTPTSYTFPKTKVGTTSAAKNFTLTNNQTTTADRYCYLDSSTFRRLDDNVHDNVGC